MSILTFFFTLCVLFSLINSARHRHNSRFSPTYDPFVDDDTCFNPTTPQDSYFSTTYLEAREKFLSAVEDFCLSCSNRRKRHSGGCCTHNIEVSVQTDKTINITPYIDISVIPGGKKATKLMLLTGGVHGGEAFVSSAVFLSLFDQLEIIDNDIYFQGEELEFDIIIVHPVNPYGMHLGRRFNEANIDLNRNAIYNDTIWEIRSDPNHFINLEYKILEDLNFTYAPRKYDVVKDDVDYWMDFFTILEEIGEGPFFKAIVQGQYIYPESTGYSGNGLSQELQLLGDYFENDLENYLKQPIADYETFTYVDLHSGLGPYGLVSLFADYEKDVPELRQIFGDEMSISSPDGDDFTSMIYRDQIGALPQGIGREYFTEIPIDTHLSFTVEWGTSPFDLLFQGVISENIAFQNEFCSYYHYQLLKRTKHTVYPQEHEEFKENVIASSLQFFETLFNAR